MYYENQNVKQIAFQNQSLAIKISETKCYSIKNAQSLRNFMNRIDLIVALIKGLSGKRSGDLFLEIQVFALV